MQNECNESIRKLEFKITLTELIRRGRDKFGLLTVNASNEQLPLENPGPSTKPLTTEIMIKNETKSKTVQEAGQLGFKKCKKGNKKKFRRFFTKTDHQKQFWHIISRNSATGEYGGRTRNHNKNGINRK